MTDQTPDIDVSYLRKKILDSMKEKLVKDQAIEKSECEELFNPKQVDDEEMMVPVDSSAIPEFGDLDRMLEKLGGPKGLAEAVKKSQESFNTAMANVPEEDRPEPLTAKEWKAVAAMQMDEGEEGGEEEPLADDSEEDEQPAASSEPKTEEPAEKKAKTE